ncbi:MULTISPECIES: hypothetical protein [unclassified Caballeronia]|uniref:hypothetical protein n=1 Tax=unclassified Caballeronia TaxID=2646786 RepID=UPI001F41E488|nr:MULTISPECIES: hypothetical protein [unclassified Caballeronia]MCE4544612.1 hypothetical protein [Caballeronia sp. PC1]MCE4571764.1 hypothetical protein [Caballeronia sp. CLC5]
MDEERHMSDYDQSRAGMCAAYGCPLLGTVGSDGRWYCFCHINKPSALNDSITRALNGELLPIVESTLDIRRCFSSFYGNEAGYRAIQKRLIGMDRKDLLFNADGKDTPPVPPSGRTMKPVVKMWLMRLERELIDQTGKFGEQERIPLTVPTAPLVGPTHATQHMPELTR